MQALFSYQGRKPLAIMSRQLDVHHIVDIEPLGMVLHLLGQVRHLGHPRPGLSKVGEVVRLLNGIPPRRILRVSNNVHAHY
jgi:hypothetical protein